MIKIEAGVDKQYRLDNRWTLCWEYEDDYKFENNYSSISIYDGTVNFICEFRIGEYGLSIQQVNKFLLQFNCYIEEDEK